MEIIESTIGRSGYQSMPVVGFVLAGTTGFQSPADDYEEPRIDLAKELVTNKANTFCWRVCGGSFEAAGIPNDSIVVIDYSCKPKPSDIVLVKLGDVASLKIVRTINGKPHLTSASEGYPVIPIDADFGVHVYGVVKHCVKSF